MTVDLDIWHAVHLDTVYVKFEGQGQRSKFTVTGGHVVIVVGSTRSYRLQPNIRFTLRSVLAVITRSAIASLKMNRLE